MKIRKASVTFSLSCAHKSVFVGSGKSLNLGEVNERVSQRRLMGKRAGVAATAVSHHSIL